MLTILDAIHDKALFAHWFRDPAMSCLRFCRGQMGSATTGYPAPRLRQPQHAV